MSYVPTAPRSGRITRTSPLPVILAIIVLTLLLSPLAALAAPERFVDSDDYKKDFRKGIITEYTDLNKGKDIDWVWIASGVKLSKYHIKVAGIVNKSDQRSKSMPETVKSVFSETFKDQEIKNAAGTLSAELCIYEAEPFTPGKAWIPFAGGHVMQAGIGIEMILTDKGKTVAKFRHFARRGTEFEQAAQESARDFTRYFENN